MKNIIYITSLVIIATSLFLAIEFADSGRISFINGILIGIGLLLNIAGFLFKKGDFPSNFIQKK